MNRKYRMYGLIPYQLSGIQKGIQFGHAVVEYGHIYANEDAYIFWSRRDKTFIILNGGTTNTRLVDGVPIGTLNRHYETLEKMGIDNDVFYEPDLGDQMTAVVFIADDRVWDRENWPDYEVPYEELDALSTGKSVEQLSSYANWLSNFDTDEQAASKIVFLRNFLKQFKLA